ncbi:MAG: alanine:cation symporter family protein [Cytophagales bacterium]|nr:alanine:cation symporter family protein [Cytophagales bacterium]
MKSALGSTGKILLLICAFFFAITSLFSYSYYGNKAMSFLAGVKAGSYYNYFLFGYNRFRCYYYPCRM